MLINRNDQLIKINILYGFNRIIAKIPTSYKNGQIIKQRRGEPKIVKVY